MTELWTDINKSIIEMMGGGNGVNDDPIIKWRRPLKCQHKDQR